MFKKPVMFIFALLVIGSMVLAACGPQEAVVTPEAVDSEEVSEPAAQPEETEPTATEAPAPEETEEEMVEPASTTTRLGGWLDEIAMSKVDADAAITQIAAGAIDIYPSNLTTPQDLASSKAAGLERSDQFGLYYEIRYNTSGPEFPATGKLNPFSNQKIREASNWLYDRDYINQEVYGGASIPKFVPITAGFPDYARYVEYIRPLETKYAYNFDKADQVITAEMEGMGAEKVDGKWMYNGEQVTLIALIRNDGDKTRIPIGDYVSNQWEALGFLVDRQYKTSSEASPIWVLGDPDDGLWHLYTGAWGVGAVERTSGDNFQFHYTPQSSYSFSPLWQTYDPPAEFIEVSEALANNTYATMDEREALFASALEQALEISYVVWIMDGKAFSAWNPDLSVAYDLAAGVDINALWPYTLKYDDKEGGLVRWAGPDIFTDPANPVAGSNWTGDSQWQIPTSNFDTINNPYTGVPLPDRLEFAEVTVLNGLPVSKNYDWVDLNFVDQIVVPEDVLVDWDAETQTFISVGEKYPEGLTSVTKTVYHYPANLYDQKWHDGSNVSLADFIMRMIFNFDPGKEASAIYDETQVAIMESFMSTFKGFKIISEDPLVIEVYEDTWYLDAEQIVTFFRSALWPEYGQGNAGWHQIAMSNLAEEAGELAYSADKSTANEVEWTNYIGGPSLEILAKYLAQAKEQAYIPYAPTLSQYIDADTAVTRYTNLENWYAEHEHFWLGTGPYMLDRVYLVEKTATLIPNPYYLDPADKWMGFSAPKLALTELDGPGLISIGAEASFDVYITFNEEPYLMEDIESVKYMLFDSTGTIVEVGLAEAIEDGYYTFTLSEEATAKMQAGAGKLEVAVSPIPVSIPSFASLEFVAE